jgi:hypothetical protein
MNDYNTRIDKLANVWANERHEKDGKVYYVFSEEALNMFAYKIVHASCWAFGETRTEPSLEKFVCNKLGIKNESS